MGEASASLPAHIRLRLNKDEILSEWINRAKKVIRAASSIEAGCLIENHPELLEELASRLDRTAGLREAKLPAEHGAAREREGKFSLADILIEYRLLREVVVDCLEHAEPLTREEMTIIDLFLMSAAEQAAVAFAAEVEESHAVAEIQFKRLVEDAKDVAIFILSPEGIIRTWNEGARRITQFTAEDVIGHRFRMLHCDEDRQSGRPERNLKLALEQGCFEERWWRVKKDGSLWWAQVLMTAIYSPQGKLTGVSNFVRDVTAQKRTEDELREATLAAEAANRLKSTFVANMSHEIRTPLGAIMGFSDLIKDSSLSPVERAEYVQVIERNGQVLLRLIEDILDISKIEAGKLEIEYRPIPVKPLLIDVVALQEIKAKDKGLSLNLRLDNEHLPETLVTDSVRLRQVLGNIIGNAIKFTARGAIQVLAGGFEQKDQAMGLEILVTDTGPGVPKDKRSRLFGEFTQADASVTRKYGGSGLGLALSRNLARELGGDVELIDTAEGTGTTFRITIANRVEVAVGASEGKMASQSLAHAAVELSEPYPHLKGSKVLLVEDSIDNQRLVSLYLKKAGVEVDLAKDGVEGVEKASHGAYSAVLMDVQMPKMDGNAATMELRKKGYDRPIIALTAHAMLEDRMKSLKAGCDDYLSKPIKSAELLTVLERWVTSSHH